MSSSIMTYTIYYNIYLLSLYHRESIEKIVILRVKKNYRCCCYQQSKSFSYYLAEKKIIGNNNNLISPLYGFGCGTASELATTPDYRLNGIYYSMTFFMDIITMHNHTALQIYT